MEQTIYESSTTLVRREAWDADLRAYLDPPPATVVSKTLKADARTPSAIARYQREFDLNQSLTSPHICQALAYDDRNHRIVFEDDDGVSLREYLAEVKPSLEIRLFIAQGIAQAVASVHDEGVIHRDLNPSNVIVINGEADPETVRVKLIDFGLATLTPRTYPTNELNVALTGTLPYVSPEQTGRVNRVVDSRSDLYSLGATLFELFAARPPFEHTDPLELIHAHIASTPPRLDEATEHVPPWLADLIDKLLAKQPENRYQSAQGVYDDLVSGSQLTNIVPFRLGRTDAVEKLVVPKKLYGRGGTQQTLSDLFERTRQGECLFACIGGGPGMGKTAICEQTRRQAQELKALTTQVNCSGLELADTDTLWIELMRPLVRQLLSLPGEQSDAVLTKLTRKASPHLNSLLPDIPELENLISPLGSTPGLPSKGIMEILDAIAPLTLVITIENAHVAPEECIARVLSECVSHRSILTLLTWEEFDDTPFKDPRIATKTTFIEMHLLDRADIRDLLSDMLSHSEAKVRELAAEVHTKTDGVPALVSDLIFELHQAGHIYFDRADGGWAWHIDEVRRYFFNSDSSDRISSLLDDLPGPARRPLCAGACAGESFDLKLVAAVIGEPEHSVAQRLRPAISNGILALSTEGHYQFSHPRVRATVYESTPTDVKQELHLAIAKALKTTPAADRSDANVASDIAQHLNAATNPVDTNEDLKVEVAHHNLLAAQASLSQGNFRNGYKFARSGLALMSNQRDTPLYLELAEAAALAAFLCGDFDQLEHVEQAAPQSSVLNEIRLRAAMVQNRLAEAAALAMGSLREIAPELIDSRPSQIRRIGRDFKRLTRWRGGGAVPPLPSPLPQLHSAQTKQAAKLVGYIAHAHFHMGEPGNRGMVEQLIARSHEQGYSGEIAFVYAIAAVEALRDDDTERARLLAQHARGIAEEFGQDAFAVRALTVVNGLVDPWFGNFDQTVRNTLATAPRLMALHDYEFAASAGAFYATNGFLRGVELGSLRRSVDEQIAHVNKHGHITSVNIQYFLLQIIASLQAQPIEDGHVHEQARSISAGSDRLAQACVYTLRLYFAVLFNDYAGAQNVIKLAHDHAELMKPSPLYALFVMCSGLATSRAPDAGENTLHQSMRALERAFDTGATFAEPKLLILKAEMALKQDRLSAALEHWEQAADCARRLGLANDEALAYELAARACDARGRADFTKLFTRNSYQAYLRWGALAKANQLERELPGLSNDEITKGGGATSLSVTDLADLTVRDFQTQQNSIDSVEYSDRVLDTTTVLRAAQTISGEIVLDRVLTKLLRLALEHAGAQKACMLLTNDEGRLHVEAIAGVDGGSTRRVTPAEPLEDKPGRTGFRDSVCYAHQQNVGAFGCYIRRRLHTGCLHPAQAAALSVVPADRSSQRGHRRALRGASLAHRCVYRAAGGSARPARLTGCH